MSSGIRVSPVHFCGHHWEVLNQLVHRGRLLCIPLYFHCQSALQTPWQAFLFLICLKGYLLLVCQSFLFYFFLLYISSDILFYILLFIVILVFYCCYLSLNKWYVLALCLLHSIFKQFPHCSTCRDLIFVLLMCLYKNVLVFMYNSRCTAHQRQNFHSYSFLLYLSELECKAGS